jgi:hypothetical protein
MAEGSGTNTKAVVEAMVFSAPRSGSGARLDENQCKKLAETRDLHCRLPRNAMGKVQKNRLRETYKDLFVSRADAVAGTVGI